MTALHQLPRTNIVHLADIQPRPAFFTAWERHRHRQAHWVVESVAESMGVFFYVYFGVGAVAGFNIGGLTDTAINTLQTVGLAFALGIMLAIVVCSATSGGHFNPAVTVCHVLFKGFPIPKAIRYITFQILGAYLACLLVYAQWHQTITAVEETLIAAGTLDEINYTPAGLAGIFACYAPAGAHLGLAFVNEFVVDFMIGLVIWACFDPTNFLTPPVAVPWIVGLTYAVAVWGFAPNGISTNAARDLGSRLAAITIWGTKANGGAYAAIAALTNIPATVCGALFYEFILMDSSRALTPIHISQITAHLSHQEHMHQGVKPMRQDRENGKTQHSSYDEDEKAHVETFEQAGKPDAPIQTIKRS